MADKDYTSHIEHKPGVTLEVDWSGPTMSYMDSDKQEQQTAYLFVATFPYSQYTYVEAAASMNQSDWLSCNIHMLEFFCRTLSGCNYVGTGTNISLTAAVFMTALL